MCGVAGFICQGPKEGIYGAHEAQKRSFIEQALYISALRGNEGSGLCLVNEPHKPPIVYKKALAANDFLQLERTKSVLANIGKYQVVLAHARSATKGDTSDENAHPFQYGHITLIHNGTAYNTDRWRSESGSDVDSAHITLGIAKEGAKSVLESINGDFAVIWHDSKEGSINVAKNAGRPLYWAKVPAWNAYVFMSELSSLNNVLARNDIKIEDKFRYPCVNVIYSFKLGERGEDFKMLPFDPASSKARASPGGAPLAWTKGAGEQQTPGGTMPTDAELEKQALARAGQNKPNQHWFPNSKRGAKKVTTRLEAIKVSPSIKFNSLYGVRARVFIPYVADKPDFGYALVHMIGPVYFRQQGEIHRLNREEFAKLKEQDWFLARSINVRNYGKERFVVFQIDPPANFAKPDDFEIDPSKMEVLSGQVATPEQRDTLKRRVLDRAITDADNTLRIFTGPARKLLTKKAWYELTKHGCHHCTGDINPLRDVHIAWVGELANLPICEKCQGDPVVMKDFNLKGTQAGPSTLQ